MLIARRSMYLQRIKKWNIRKNYKASQKQAVLDLLEKPHKRPCWFGSSSIPLHRIKRHARDKHRAGLLVKAPSSHSRDACHKFSLRQPWLVSSTKSLHSECESSDENPGDEFASAIVMDATFLYSPCERSSELFLLRLREYVQVRLPVAHPATSKSTKMLHYDAQKDRSLDHRRLVNNLIMANTALGTKEVAEAFKCLDQACDLGKRVLQEAHWRLFELFGILRRLLDRDLTSGFFVTRFFLQMAMTLFSTTPDHCIIHIFRLFLDLPHNEVMEVAGDVVLAMVQQVIPEDIYALDSARIGVVNLYLDSGLPDAALDMAKRAHECCLVNLGASHSLTKRATYTLVRSHYLCKQFTQACQAAQALMQVYDKEALLPDDYGLLTCGIAANSCLALGRLDNALQFYYSVAECRLEMYPWLYRSIEVLMPAQEYSQRMVHNIERGQGKAPDFYSFEYSQPYSFSSMSSKLADEHFGYWSEVHGW